MISALKSLGMSLKFRLLSFLSRNTLSRKHDVGILFTWACCQLLRFEKSISEMTTNLWHMLTKDR